MNRVAIFAATSWEVQAVLAAGHAVERTRVAGLPAAMFPCRHAWCYVIQTGVGPQQARQVAGVVLADAKWDVAISAGFAGSLIPARVGSVLVGTQVTAVGRASSGDASGSAIRCHPALVRAACVLAGAAETTICGSFISTDEVVWRAEDKRSLAALYDAVAVDMESASLASVVGCHGVPFAVVRTVSDLVEESLPVDFNLFVRRADRMSGWLQGIARCVTRPSGWAGLARLRRQSRLAAGRLTGFLGPYLETLVQRPDLG